MRTVCTFLGLTLFFLLFQQESMAQRRKDKKAKASEEEVSIYDLDSLISAIPRNRMLWHDRIDEGQRRADLSDGRDDGQIEYPDDTNFTKILSRAMLSDLDQVQVMIENMPDQGRSAAQDNQEKIRYLTFVHEFVQRYNREPNPDPFYYMKASRQFKDLMIARHEGEAMEYVKSHPDWITLDLVHIMFEPSSAEAEFIYSTLGKEDPDRMIDRLREFAMTAYADEIIAAAARVSPNKVFNFATSTVPMLSGAIRRSKDPLVQSIAKIARESTSPLRAMPFLGDIHHNRLTVAEVDQITGDPDRFYQNLVRLKIQNEGLGANTYTDELKYRGLRYVREMNDLHDEKDAIRFRCIEGFDPETIYFILAYGNEEIYTSSFLGAYKRMMAKLKPRNGAALLDTVHKDRFRTFLRMCAGYNTLDSFLATMPSQTQTALLEEFVAGLDKGRPGDLEDAVDVADAFGSISNPELRDFLRQEVKTNYEQAYKDRSKKGIIVYGLLATLFEGAKGGRDQAALQSRMLDLPPINLVPFDHLVSESGIVYQQIFFYGDEDGKISYQSFLKNFRSDKWKIEHNEYWTQISSIKGKPVVIFANLPLPEPKDEEAVNRLKAYLAKEGIKPTILIHRGHSYHLPVTIDGLQKENRIVILGSCGGYHNLSTVLNHSPNAHIISSKQVGAMNVNEPIIREINQQLLEGRDIDWIQSWENLQQYFSADVRRKAAENVFIDYVPPHQNLGAIFIKAYRKQFHRADLQEAQAGS